LDRHFFMNKEDLQRLSNKSSIDIQMKRLTPLFSMPNGHIVLLPLTLGLIAALLAFKTLSNCDMIITEWNIDCSTPTTSNCMYISYLSMGLLTKESLVGIQDENNNVLMEKVCQWHGEDDKTWLLDPLWIISKWCVITCIVLALFNIGILLISSCYKMESFVYRRISFSFGFIAVLSAVPFTLYFASGVCNADVSVCDETQTNCVMSCKMGTGSWQLLASSFTFLSTMISSLLVQGGIVDDKTSESHDPAIIAYVGKVKRTDSQTDSDASSDENESSSIA
jgi:hypothetical protein